MYEDLKQTTKIDNINGWTTYKVSAALQEAWTDRNIYSGIKVAYRNKITKAVFVAELRFGGKVADEGLNSNPEQISQKDGRDGRKKSRSRKRAGTDSRQMSSNKRTIYWTCGSWYNFFTYVLFTGKNLKGHKILKDN